MSGEIRVPDQVPADLKNAYQQAASKHAKKILYLPGEGKLKSVSIREKSHTDKKSEVSHDENIAKTISEKLGKLAEKKPTFAAKVLRWFTPKQLEDLLVE